MNFFNGRSPRWTGAAPPPRKRHIGAYAVRRPALERFPELPASELGRLESLERLRWLAAGGKLRVLPARHRPPGIDSLEDYRAFVARQASIPSNSPRT